MVRILETGKHLEEYNLIYQNKVKIFNTTCITVLLYGCESLVVSKDMDKKINSFATSCCRIMLGNKRIDKISHAEVIT